MWFQNVVPDVLKKLRNVSNTSEDSTNPRTLHKFANVSAFQLDCNSGDSENNHVDHQ